MTSVFRLVMFLFWLTLAPFTWCWGKLQRSPPVEVPSSSSTMSRAQENDYDVPGPSGPKVLTLYCIYVAYLALPCISV
jgi:hypothetical protein